MTKKYIVNVVNGSTIHFAEAFVISYNAPKLVLRLSAKDRDKIQFLCSHAAQSTEMNFQLEWRGTEVGKDNQLWDSPRFRARVTAADEPSLQFELTLVDFVDLSGLELATSAA